MNQPRQMDWPESRISRLRRFTVLSPHLDDAALSLGGTIARAARAGAEVTVLTVLGGDPEDRRPAGEWDRGCGFTSAGEAIRARRLEEARACRRLRARGLQLPFADDQYAGARRDTEAWEAIEPLLAGAEAVLIPGWPLKHADHRWVTRLALGHLPGRTTVGLYVDQPYAVWETSGHPDLKRMTRRALEQAARSRAAAQRQIPGLVPGVQTAAREVSWQVVPLDAVAQMAKVRAVRAYESQLRGFGRLFLTQIMLYAWADRGEPIGWLE